jgi:hypothetical protein
MTAGKPPSFDDLIRMYDNRKLLFSIFWIPNSNPTLLRALHFHRSPLWEFEKWLQRAG